VTRARRSKKRDKRRKAIQKEEEGEIYKFLQKIAVRTDPIAAEQPGLEKSNAGEFEKKKKVVKRNDPPLSGEGGVPLGATENLFRKKRWEGAVEKGCGKKRKFGSEKSLSLKKRGDGGGDLAARKRNNAREEKKKAQRWGGGTREMERICTGELDEAQSATREKGNARTGKQRQGKETTVCGPKSIPEKKWP